METPRILVVDDERDLRQLIQTALQKEGFQQIETAASMKEGIEKFEAFKPDIAILDIMLPDGDGYELCKKIRETSYIPVLFLSAKSEEFDKVLGLAIGGDDYITKPFSPKELAFRVKAQLRRAGYKETMNTAVAEQRTIEQDDSIEVGPFKMNSDGTELIVNGEIMELTAKEVGLMHCFMRNPNRIISKETLFERVWGEDFFGSDNTVMVHIRRLREKIEADPSKPQYIKTVKGLGYKFQAK